MEVDKNISKIWRGDTQYIQKYIKQNPRKINKTNSWGLTYLMVACRLGNTDLINFLIKSGADLNMRDRDGKTASHYAVFAHQSGVVAIMVSKGANINSQDHLGNTPLHCAAEKNREDMVKVILKTKVKEFNKQNNNGRTPLHLACMKGHIDIAHHLLQCNSDVNIRDNTGSTPLHVVCNEGDADIVRLLLHLPNTDISMADNDGNSPLHHAANRGHTVIVRLLLHQTGIHLNMVSNSGDTPLHLAVLKQHYDVVALMLSQSDVAVDIKNCNKMTPLLQAVSGGHLGMIQKLLSHGADINAVDNNDNNCLHLAVKKGMFHSEGEALGILDECCALLNLGKNARLSGEVIATYLALQGANFYHRNHNNVTPLDLVTNPDLKEKLKSNFPSLCLFCEAKASTLKCQSCGHVVICEECSNKTQCKTCPECQKTVTRKSGIESPKLKEKDLLKVAKRLGSNWWQVGIFLGVKTSELEIYNNSKDNVKQGYMVLHKWFKSCDPEKRTLETLRDALKEAECLDAFKSLSPDVK